MPVNAPHKDQCRMLIKTRWYHEFTPFLVLDGEGFFYMTAKQRRDAELMILRPGGVMIEQNNSASNAALKPESLPKAYEPQAVESKWYRFWEEGGYFKPRPGATGKPFVISMPPPNVTGALHLGHAITATIEDILIRYHRMLGDDIVWVPGEDHASIT